MKVELDSTKLAERERWQRRNFNDQRARVASMLEHLTLELRRDMEQDPTAADLGGTDQRSAGQVAASIEHLVIQAVNNMDFRGLTDTAADLDVTLYAADALETYKAGLPGEVRAAIEAVEVSDLEARVTKHRAEKDARAARLAASCEKRVHEVGRSVGLRRCANKATWVIETRDGKRLQVCGAHKKTELEDGGTVVKRV